jgi:hypothetical protein
VDAAAADGGLVLRAGVCWQPEAKAIKRQITSSQVKDINL